MAAAVAAELRATGHTVVTPSWNEYLRPGSDLRASLLRPLLTSTVGALYAGARDSEGIAVLDTLASRGKNLVSDAGEPLVTERDLGRLDIASNRPESLLAAGLSMLAAQLLMHELVVRPALAEGCTVIQDSHGIKAVVKSIVLADRSLPRNSDAEPVREFRSFLWSCLRTWAAPSMGVLLTGDPRTALQRKTAARDLTFTEHFGLTGAGGESSFVSFQERLQDELRVLAGGAGWTEVTVRGGTKDESVSATVDVVLAMMATPVPSGAGRSEPA
ncbi:hypothetical protein CFN78_02895 [Amycolatopsis antarctica]|uniref:Uncharacterized protein n=1 Tax=Amycolatopsis antarctica TaxID=1854586 RepID=A0A263DAW9_9PSEU|nr:hypothetical protein CFN78_02895 [Amycolatopsis antarctica]